MKTRKALITTIVACTIAAVSGCATSRPVPLFNGKDFTGFYTFLRSKGVNQDPDKVFQVENGQIHVSGAEYGYVASTQEFANYDLKVEYRWGGATHPPRVDRARDSGLLFHATGPDQVWPKSVEFQIIEGGTGDALLVRGTSMNFDEALRPRMAGKDMLSPDGKHIVNGRVNWAGRSPLWKDVTGFRGERDLERPTGEWNQLELRTDGDAFIYWVNGTQVLHGTGSTPSKGKIVLQSEGAEIYFRNIQLRVRGPV